MPSRIVSPRARSAPSSARARPGRHAGEQLVGQLHDGDLGAELGEGATELDADVAAADDGQPGRHPTQGEGGGGVEHRPSVEREARQLDGPGPGGQDHRLELVEGGVVAPGHRHPAAGGEPGGAGGDRDAGVAQQLPDAAGQPVDDVADPGLSPVEVDGGGEVDADAGRLGRQAGGVGHVDQRFRRDAPDVEADTADAVPFHEGHAAAGGRRPERGGVPARAAADDEQVDAGGDLADDHQEGTEKTGAGQSEMSIFSVSSFFAGEELGQQGDRVGEEAGDVLGEGGGDVTVDQPVVA